MTISRGSFVFSRSRVKVSASLTNIGSLAVGAFNLVNCSMSVLPRQIAVGQCSRLFILLISLFSFAVFNVSVCTVKTRV